ncbi:hypothetical protein F4802DRAFT_598946 [Xylaria palmicola]|nr:hypothetical protein F4802DRAFT_598946 [Xylaria palmicola]
MEFAEYFYSLPAAQQQALLNGPSIPPPPGVTPQFDNPPNQNASSRTWINVVLAIATLAVVLRIDQSSSSVIALSGYGLLIAYDYCIYEMINGAGLFVHQWDIRLKDLSGEVYWIHLSADFYAISILTLKVAILLEWNRMFSPHGIKVWFTVSGTAIWNHTFLVILIPDPSAITRCTYLRTCYLLIALNTLFFSAAVTASALSCHPYKRIWDRTIPGYCINTMILAIASSGFNFFSDIAILLLPQRIIWCLHTTPRRKIGISILFAIGIAAVVFGIVRLVVTARYIVSTDVTYTISSVGIWCSLELLAAILIFCIPAIPKIFDEKTRLGQLFTSLRSSFDSRNSSFRTRRSTGSARPGNGPGSASPKRGYEDIGETVMLKDLPAPLANVFGVPGPNEGPHEHYSEEPHQTFYEESIEEDTRGV